MKKNSKRRRFLIVLGVIILFIIVFINIPESKKRIATQHFSFVYSSSIDSGKIAELASNLENYYSKISQDLKTIPVPIIDVNIYASRWRYIKATKNWSASGNIEGISKLHFVEQAWGEADSKKVAVHEFTHTIVLKMLLDREHQPVDSKSFEAKFAKFPTWLWEATSVYEAEQFKDPKTLPYLSNNSYPDLNELNNRSKGGKIYDVGYTIVEYILSKYGQDKLIELIINYGNILKTLGITDNEFTKNWYDFIKEKYLTH